MLRKSERREFDAHLKTVADSDLRALYMEYWEKRSRTHTKIIAETARNRGVYLNVPAAYA